MKKLILVNSPLIRERFQEGEQFLPPLGLGYIATHTSKAGIDTEIIDTLYESLSVEKLIALIKVKQPDFVGLNVFSPNLEIVKEIISMLPLHITVVLGGQVMKSIYKDIMGWNTQHKIIMIFGEGELIFPKIIEGKVEEPPIEENDLCKVYSVSCKSIYFPRLLADVQLERRLFADRALINPYGLKEACMISSRGCLYNCAFCGAANKNNRDTYPRHREKADIIEEIHSIKSLSPDVECIRMLDDLFLSNRKSILNAIDIFTDVNLKWRAMCHALSLKNNEDLLQKLQSSGCVELFIGIESGSKRIRNKIHKLGELEYIQYIIKRLLTMGISVKGYFMYGLPEESLEDMKETFEFARSLHNLAEDTLGNFRNSTFQFRPYHGTELYHKIIAGDNNIKSFSLDRSMSDFSGRQQFNIVAGNYSDCDQEIVEDFIRRTERLNHEQYSRANKKM